jgi:hypothetical protein
MTDKPNQTKDNKDTGAQRQQRKPWQKRNQGRYEYSSKKKDPEEIPILKYGPYNNFAKFKEAISKTALKNYGQLGKLIKLGDYYEPEKPDSTDSKKYDLANDPLGIERATYLEDLKEYRKEVIKMQNERPKLYALILQYLSEESLDEIKRSDKFDKIDEETDPLALWLLVEETHKVNSISKVATVTKMAARSTYQTMRQGAYESIITYKERFTTALKAYVDQKNPNMEDQDVAMDFFRGLDNARYSQFKTEIMNGLTAGSIKQPDDLNAMYLLANQWLKTTTRNDPKGYATTFTTTLDNQERSNRRSKKHEKKNGDSEKKEKKDKDMSKIECYACGAMGHYANKCPSRQQRTDSNENEEQEQDRNSHVTWHASTFNTYQVCTASQEGRFKRSEVLLDNQADVSIVHPSLLRDVQRVDRAVKINGVAGHQFTVKETGFLDPLFRVYASEKTQANILSLSEVEDRYLVTYVPQECFIIHLPHGDIEFRRKEGMYVADWDHYRNAFSTSVCTKAEEARAKQAYEFLRTSGFPSLSEAIHLVEDGNIAGMPALTGADVRKAYELFGTPPAYVRGKMTKRKVSRAVINDSLIMEEKKQSMYTDVMHIENNMFLISVCEPLQLTLQCPLESESKNQLGLALQGHMDILRERGFIPTVVYTDPQRAFTSLTGSFPGVVIDTGGAKDNVAKVDAKIRRVKELFRSVKESLSWKIPKRMVKDLVAYAVARINIRRTTAINLNVCPKVLFTGIKINYKKELELAFGDYCEVYDGTDNTSASRSIPCIALCPCNNATGSWEFMNLKTKTRVRRSQWKKMVTSELIIDVMNYFDEKDRPVVPAELQQQEPEAEAMQEAVVNPVAEETGEIREELTEVPANLVEEEDNDVPELVDAVDDPDDSDDEDDDEASVQEPGIASRTRSQTGTETKPPKRYAMAVKINKNKETDSERRKAMDKADKEEIELLFVDLQGLLPVKEEEIAGQQVYNSHMFGVEKFLADGSHDKFKSRLVFDGRDQDPELFPDRSSPTAALHSLMSCVAVASANGMTKIGKIDVKGAFIQTEMEGPPLYIRCNKDLTKLIVEVLPGIKKYVTKDGVLFCRLMKALYGCVQASKLWFNKLTKFLRAQGYEHSPTDPCVMRKIVGSKIFLLVIYVDDILVFANDEEMKNLKDAFIKEFQWITMEVGASHSYLGMQITMKDRRAIIDMSNFIEKLLDNCNEKELKKHSSPAGKDIFTVDEKASVLNEAERRSFHTSVAKLLYLSKRARPDILTATGFLCTRVTCATEQDRAKLRRLLGYLKATRKKKLHLKPKGTNELLEAFVDAAFAPHPDAKSQTGIAIFIAGMLVYAASRKQKCVTKSPTDSELVALSDNISFIELFAEFFAFITNTKFVSPMIYQDCTAVISLVTECGGVVRTKHLRVRMELCKEALKEQRIRVSYVSTDKMLADGLTKALEGQPFQEFAQAMIGTSMD